MDIMSVVHIAGTKGDLIVHVWRKGRISVSRSCSVQRVCGGERLFAHPSLFVMVDQYESGQRSKKSHHGLGLL